jgi:hypothetical protein
MAVGLVSVRAGSTESKKWLLHSQLGAGTGQLTSAGSAGRKRTNGSEIVVFFMVSA